MTDHPEPRRSIEEPPPILGRWRNIYALVLAVLLLEIIAFTALTRWLQ